LRLLRAGLNQLGEAKFAALRLVTFLMTEALARAGQIAEGLAMIEEAIARSEQGEEHWLIAELSRVKGELLLLQGAPGAAEAVEEHFRQALRLAALLGQADGRAGQLCRPHRQAEAPPERAIRGGARVLQHRGA
jgi:predicted ATPase